MPVQLYTDVLIDSKVVSFFGTCIYVCGLKEFRLAILRDVMYFLGIETLLQFNSMAEVCFVLCMMFKGNLQNGFHFGFATYILKSNRPSLYLVRVVHILLVIF